MPIWLRRFTFNSMNEFYEKEQEEYRKASGKGELVTNKTPIAKPNLPMPTDAKPTYASKASRK